MTDGTASRGPREILKAARQDSRRKVVRRWLPTLCHTIMIVGFVNLVLFVAGTFYVGGDAWNGKIEDQKYYVWGYHNGHKGYTEVSRGVFEYSRWHVYSLMVTWPFVLVAGFAAERVRRLEA